MALVKKRSTLQIWGDVIFAIFLREIKSKFSDKLGIAWSVISPVAFIMILSLMRGMINGGTTHTIPTFFFMVYGMVLVQMLLATVASVSASINVNKSLFAFRQVQPISSVIAIASFEFLTKLFVLLFIYLIAYFLRIEVVIGNSLFALKCFVQVWLIATSLGLLFALGRCFVPELEKLRSLAMRPIFFISGIFFSLQDIPKEYWYLLDWNPLLHAVELTRFAAYPSYGSMGVSHQYLNLCTLIIIVAALICYQNSWKQAISR
ncbi:ABC transporter [Psychromonas sp. psych-6C06]|uniref:ABC transporter permease n=1 Tax=Psychromonas sp. psych-6C06 TaxID=2058089 RepID=UPI000C33FE5E|nr:ABC transporter permease [Psychromonas sp. psych-6C06]PKF62539.1 ABC transporter [Psychromonas sp. psych-6C06]